MIDRDKRLSFEPVFSMAVLGILLALSSFAAPGLSEAEGALSADIGDTLDTSAEPTAESEVVASGQASDRADTSAGPLSKLQIHGFLTQAYADAQFADIPIGMLPSPPNPPGTIGPLGASPTFLELSLGIPEDGTTNYRFLALQFRYDISQKDIFVVQFSSRTLGFSPLQDFEDEIELDWAFYERRLTDYTSLKVGRVQIPFGIYNEVRDVGTILPFYRPAFVYYKEGSFTSETVDGLSLAHTFFPASDWSLELTAFAGQWESIQIFPFAPEDSGIVTADDGYGYQIWLNTPISDVRIGTGLLSFNSEGGPFPTLDRRNIFHGSLDANLGRITLQAEWSQETEAGLLVPGLGEVLVKVSEWYALVGARITDKFRIWAQFEAAKRRDDGESFVAPLTFTQREDFGIALNYFFTPSLVLKGEHHWVDEVGTNFFFDFSTFKFQEVPFSAPNGSYSILALSVSF